MDIRDQEHEQHQPMKIGVRPADSPMAQDIRGVAVGLDEDGRVVIARSGLSGMSANERARVAHALADLLGEVLAGGGAAGMVRVH